MFGDPKPEFLKGQNAVGYWPGGKNYSGNIKEPYFHCGYCGSKATGAWAALFCYVSHHVCKTCGKAHLVGGGVTTNSYYDAMASIDAAHSCCFKYKCRDCGQKYQYHQSAKDCCPPYTCDNCGAGFQNRSDARACCTMYSCESCGEEYYESYEANECCASSDDEDGETEDSGCEGSHCYHPDKTGDVLTCCCCNRKHSEKTVPTGLEWEVNRHVQARFPAQSEYVRVAMADFYLLEYMGIAEHYAPAAQRLMKFEAKLAAEWAAYLDRAIGGELRHAYKSHVAPQIRGYIKAWKHKQREAAWSSWEIIRKQHGAEALKYALDAFNDQGAWTSQGYGGEAWANCAKVLLAYVKGEIPARIFIDRCCSLEHNGGCVFNKSYNVTFVRDVLNAHAEGDFKVLLRHCSPEVNKLWRARHWRQFEGRSEEYRQMVAPSTLDYDLFDVLNIEKEGTTKHSIAVYDYDANPNDYEILNKGTYYENHTALPSRHLRWEVGAL